MVAEVVRLADPSASRGSRRATRFATNACSGTRGRLLQFARLTSCKAGHEQRVARLALRLFDQLQSLHGLGARHRHWLEAASLLHDVGKVDSRKAHHKASLRIILNTRHLPLRGDERVIVGLTARYHRGALPRNSHKHFRDLCAADKDTVETLAALLRLADGLDSIWDSSLRDLDCTVQFETVVVNLTCTAGSIAHAYLPRHRTVLFENLFERSIVLRRSRQAATAAA